MPISRWNPAVRPLPRFSVPRKNTRLVLLAPLTMEVLLASPAFSTWRMATSAMPPSVTCAAAWAE
jgi:hypothetical protein